MHAFSSKYSKLRGLLDTEVKLASHPEAEELAGLVLAEYGRLTGARGGSFYLREGTTFRLYGTLDPGHAPPAISLPFSDGSILRWVETERRAFRVRSIADVPDILPSSWAGYRGTSSLVFPICAPDNTCIGFVCLHDRHHGRFSKHDEELGGILALLCAEAIYDLRFAADLRDSELRYREVFNNSPSGILLLEATTDLRFRILAANPAVEALSGFRAAEVAGRFIDEILPPAQAEFLTDGYRRCVRLAARIERRAPIDLPTGRKMVKTTLVPIQNEDRRVYRILALPIDHTGLASTEAALRESEQRFREVFENTSDGIAVLDPLALRTEAINPAMERMLGISKDAAQDRPFESLLRGSAAAMLRESASRSIEERRMQSFDAEIELESGRSVWHTTLIPVSDESARIHRLIVVASDVTEMMHMQRRLEQSEEKFSKAFHASPDSISITRIRDGVFLEVNRGFTEVNGYTRDEVIGRSPVSEALAIWADPSDRDRFVGRVREQGEVNGYPAAFRRRDGTIRNSVLSSRLVDIGGESCLLTVARDLTERQRMEAELSESEARYREIFLNTSDGIFVVEVTKDSRFKLLSINPAQERMLGVNAANAVGKYSNEYLPPGLAEKADTDNIACVTAGTPMAFEESYDWPEGRAHYVTTIVPVKDREGTVVRLIGVTRDITERKRAAERERAHEQQLFQAAKLSTLGTLVSGIAHEINNPNNFIRLNIQNLKTFWGDIHSALEEAVRADGELFFHGIPYDSAREMIEELMNGIEEGTKRIERLISNLRDYARGDQGELDGSVNLRSVIESATMIVRNLIQKSTDSFTVRGSERLPPVRGNYNQLEQVVMNLVSNACQSLPSRDRAVSVVTSYDGPGGSVVLEVEDQGIGIPEAVLARVTDPFFTTKQANGGSGLGLAISSRIVANHGGTLSFDSVVGRGTRVTVHLPVAGGSQ